MKSLQKLSLVTVCLTLALSSATAFAAGEEIVSSFDAPSANPTGLAWDGTYLWYGDPVTAKIYRINTSGNVTVSFDSPGDNLRGIAWDGEHLWCGCYVPGSGPMICELDVTGNMVDSFPQPFVLTDLAWGESYLWGLGYRENEWYGVHKIDPTTGDVLSSFLLSYSVYPVGLAWDGEYLWYGDSRSMKIYKLDPTTGAVSYYFTSPGDILYSIASDGTYAWVVTRAYGENVPKVNKIDLSDVGEIPGDGEAPTNGGDGAGRILILIAGAIIISVILVLVVRQKTRLRKIDVSGNAEKAFFFH